MKREVLKKAAQIVLFAAVVVSATFPFSGPVHAQEGMISLTRDEIIAGAKKEGKVSLSPGYDQSAIPHLVKAFRKRYPFIDASWDMVTGITAAQRQLFEMAAGKSSLDAFSPHSSQWSDYFRQNLIKRYDFKAMAKAGHLKMPLKMIDDSGVVVWLGSNMAVIAYNFKLVPLDKAPTGWESCIDPQWKGKIAVDTKPNTLSWLVPLWGEEKALAYARKLKENDPIWVRGQTGHLLRLGTGEYPLNCSMYLHTTLRSLKKDPALPVKLVVPDPLAIAFHEPEGIYANAKNPHAGLLWIEFLASREAQDIADAEDPGKASFLVEGTISNGLVGGRNLSICGGGCRDQEDNLIARIAVEAWGLPKVGYSPKKK
ncbi:MAG: ABC transporter substrate-binding protein [Deltaproteobacteria bacterium]|nr:ABC transporter substrate-binding protein [Deltaproteobacteria bacterium]